METYKERVMRYRILRHDELPEAHKAEMRINGIDPDDSWNLIWSFNDKEAAATCLAECIEDAASWMTYKMVDAGQETVIERPIW